MKSVKYILFISLLILFACTKETTQKHTKMKKLDPKKPYAWGKNQTIYVFADNSVWKYAEKHLRKSLERFQFTTTNESYFELKRADYNAIDQFYKFNNLIFLCDLQSDAPVSDHVKSIMNDTIKEDVSTNNVGMYPIENLWANDQYVLFLIGDNEENLLKLTILQSEKIFELFKEKLIDRIALSLYQQKVYSDNSFKKYPWNAKIPKKYVVFKEDNHFISFLSRLSEHPDKFFAVYYEEMLENKVTKDWLIEKRKKIFWKYYDEDTFSLEDIRQERYKLKDFAGVKISGRWQNRKLVAGGAFQTFAFYDKNTKTAFIIDNTVYFPQGDKLKALLELEVISNTFKIKNDTTFGVKE